MPSDIDLRRVYELYNEAREQQTDKLVRESPSLGQVFVWSRFTLSRTKGKPYYVTSIVTVINIIGLSGRASLSPVAPHPECAVLPHLQGARGNPWES
jgi:hypothetical protein